MNHGLQSGFSRVSKKTQNQAFILKRQNQKYAVFLLHTFCLPERVAAKVRVVTLSQFALSTLDFGVAHSFNTNFPSLYGKEKKTKLKEENFTLAHGFRGFHPWLCGSISFSHVARKKHHDRRVQKGKLLPHADKGGTEEQEERCGREDGTYPQLPSSNPFHCKLINGLSVDGVITLMIQSPLDRTTS